jgi:hypothetical protein
MSKNNNEGFYFSEEVGFEPIIKKNDNKKKEGDKQDGKKKGKKNKQ